MNTFEEAIEHHFPGSVDEADYVKRSLTLLEPHGFTADNTIACVGTCRDELCLPLKGHVLDVWGEAFNFSSLGGLLTLGRTGFHAAHAHSPVDGGRTRHVYFCMPHIGIGPKGEVGSYLRPGMERMSTACGALVAVHKELSSGSLNLSLDMLDIEQSLLKNRMVRMLTWGEMPDLGSFTKLMEQAIKEDLEQEIVQTCDTDKTDYAVFTGVQIHGPDGHYVCPRTSYAVVSGERVDVF